MRLTAIVIDNVQVSIGTEVTKVQITIAISVYGEICRNLIANVGDVRKGPVHTIVLRLRKQDFAAIKISIVIGNRHDPNFVVPGVDGKGIGVARTDPQATCAIWGIRRCGAISLKQESEVPGNALVG